MSAAVAYRPTPLDARLAALAELAPAVAIIAQPAFGLPGPAGCIQFGATALAWRDLVLPDGCGGHAAVAWCLPETCACG